MRARLPVHDDDVDDEQVQEEESQSGEVCVKQECDWPRNPSRMMTKVENCVPASMPMTDWLLMDGRVISRTTVNHKYRNCKGMVCLQYSRDQCLWDSEL